MRKDEREKALESHVFKSLFDNSPVGFWILDIPSGRVVCNDAFERLAMLPNGRTKCSFDCFADIVHPDDADKFVRHLDLCRSGSLDSHEEVFRIEKPDGSFVWVTDSCIVIERNKAGKAVKICGSIRDMDDRIRTEHELRETLADKQDQNKRLMVEVEQATGKIFKTRMTSVAMFESNPYINILFDSEGNAVDCNPAAVKYFEFTSKRRFLGGIIEKLTAAIPPIQPDGRKSIPLKERLDAAAKQGCNDFETNLLLDGKIVPFSVQMKRIPYENSYAIVLYMIDLSDLNQIKIELLRRDTLLETVNAVAANLVAAGPETFDHTIRKALEMLANAVNTDRAYIWENFESDGEKCARLIYSWHGNKKLPPHSALADEVDYSEVPLWHDMLSRNEAINGPVANQPDAERARFESRGVKSVLIIPLYYDGRFWGLIGFDDFTNERTFTEAEEQVLRSGAILMTSGIYRNNMTRRLIDTKKRLEEQEKLLRSVNDVGILLMKGGEQDFKQTVRHALRTLGVCIGAYKTGIWRNETVDGVLYSTRLICWNASKPDDGTNHVITINLADYIPEWGDTLFREDAVLAASQLDKAHRELISMDGSGSVLMIPLNIQGDFWGVIGFIHRGDNHQFSHNEKAILRSAGMLIASAVIRNEITESLVEAKESALASMRAKSDFLSRMSHEIRTPMNAIIGMTALARKADDIGKIQQFLKKVDSSSRQLLGIINDVLDMSKIEADKLEIDKHEFDFEKMIENVINVIQVKLDEKRQTLSLDMHELFTRNIVTDELRLSQVLLNLLSNAVKFSPEQGKISLKIRNLPAENGSRLHIEVMDDGIGIDPSQKESIFSSFEQADGGITRKYGGTGLGLAISKKIISLMGGDIWVDTAPGGGANFIFEIGVEWGGSCVADIKRNSLRQNLRILVVDDSQDTLDYFQNMLDDLSLHCDTATGGAEAVKMAREQLDTNTPYDVVFIDWYMPDMDGGETAKEILRIMDNDVIVVMISTADWHEIQQKASEAGVRHFLPKPILPSTLYDMIAHLTDRKLTVEDMTDGEAAIDLSGKKILLVDDIDLNREIVSGILEESDVSIEYAEDGVEALEMFYSSPEKYDLILMDIQMPIMDGITATKLIRNSELPHSKTIPIVAMTANAFKEDERACIDAGMNRHIAKPIDVSELYGTLRELL